MNTYLRENPWYDSSFKDPLLWDTRLTDRGVRQASSLVATTARVSPPPQLVAVSPLTRALHTADLAFATHKNGGARYGRSFRLMELGSC